MNEKYYRNVAPWIRGRVTLATTERSGGGRPHYWYDVVNTRTGEVLVHTDAYGFEELIKSASHTTGAARAAWFWSLDAKQVES